MQSNKICISLNFRGMPLSKQIEFSQEFLKKLSGWKKYQIKPRKVGKYIVSIDKDRQVIIEAELIKFLTESVCLIKSFIDLHRCSSQLLQELVILAW